MTRAYQAYGPAGRVTASTPRAAAAAYFATHPGRRTCDVIAGEIDGPFFTVRYGRASEGDWPSSWKGITPRTAGTLPDA